MTLHCYNLLVASHTLAVMEHYVSASGGGTSVSGQGDHTGALLAGLMSLVLGALTWVTMELVRISASG